MPPPVSGLPSYAGPMSVPWLHSLRAPSSIRRHVRRSASGLRSVAGLRRDPPSQLRPPHARPFTAGVDRA
ncbi:hypothetical protein NDU88_002967 [Pleurodeles waltl]|uniref:Uncharacterized protein n=1 Tax=Pleurodeles waltl TaxID=8319 RepID=A0AAV7T472_PLEWA|nr:hypothetical protein NDU88_002967 [Pleurodeles waltl]